MPRAAKLSALALIMTVLSAMAWVTPAMALDTTPPNTTITSTVPPVLFGTVTQVTGATFNFSATEASTFECKVDGSVYTFCGSDSTGPDFTGTVTYASLADGLRTFSVRATDLAHNVDSSAATGQWKIDTAPPQTTILTGPDVTIPLTATSFTFSSEVGATFQCQLSPPGGWEACNSPQPYSGMPDGSKTFSVRATDLAGNVDPSPANRNFAVDTVAPNTVIDSPPPSVSATSATFTFHSNEAPVTFQCQLDLSAWAACPSPKSYSGIANGPHTFSVVARDAGGLLDTSPATVTWTKDTTAPDTILAPSGPTGSTTETTGTFTFSSEVGATFQCKLDQVLPLPVVPGAWGACASPMPVGPLGDGTWTFSVKATDANGLIDATPATRTWKIDSTPPETFLSWPYPTLIVSSSLAVFDFTTNEAGTFQCQLDSGGWLPCTSPKSYPGLADGDHTFDVRAIDLAGNVDPTPWQNAWAILGGDTTGPTAVIDSGPTGTTPATSATFTFHSSELPATFECQLDTAAWAACNSPKVYPGPLAAGAHTFSVKAFDAFLNPSAAVVRTWTIGKVPTTLSIKAPDSAKHGTRVTVSGVLQSDDPTCESAQKVYLKAGTTTLGPRTTSTTGAYSYSVYIGTSNKGVKAVYKGTTKCASVSSERLVITST